MAKSAVNNTRLGVLVILGLVLLMAALYFVGQRQSLFGSTITLRVNFEKVSGLQEGNNVRFSGINVGSVKSITILHDTIVQVVMMVEEDAKKFIRKNSMVSIGSDGLMGNALLNIDAGSPDVPMVQNNDLLPAKVSVTMESMMETLQKTNVNAAHITDQLAKTVDGINKGEGTLGMLLKDQDLVLQLKETVASANKAAANTARFTSEMNGVIRDAKKGDGTIGTLLYDTATANSLRRTVNNLKLTTERTAALSDSLTLLVSKASNGEGTIGTILNDTTLSGDLKESMHNIKEITTGLNEIMGNVKESPAMQSLHKNRKKKKEK
ncbi:MAG: MCE family protein [Chitinophagaceae bacterium]|nr:MAG: MCE family protein [Chitinophagaceae bacterium]